MGFSPVSRFFPAIIEFKPYSAEELFDILKDKAGETVAALIAWESSKTGDCRLAIQMMERFQQHDVKGVLREMEGLRL